MGKKIIVIAPHGNEELVKKCKSKDKFIVYLPNERVRNVVSRREGRYEAVFVNYNEHDDACFNGHEMELAKEVVDFASDWLKKDIAVVFILIPIDMMSALEFQVLIKGKAFREEFDIIVQQFTSDFQIEPEYIFRITERKISAQFSQFELIRHEGYNKAQVDKAAQKKAKVIPKQEVSTFDEDLIYERLASGDAVDLNAMQDSELRLIVDKCLDKRRYDLVRTVNAILLKRENQAS